MFRALALLGAAVLLAGCAPKPSPVDRMYAALGGYEAIARLENLWVDADCEGPSGGFRTQLFSSRPGRVYFRQTSDRDSVEIWSTPERTWGVTADAPPAVRALVRGHEFHLLLFEFERRFREIEVVDSGPDSVRLTMQDEHGLPAQLTLDAKSGLPRELTLNPEGAAGALSIRFADWRKQGELLYFHELSLREGSTQAFTYRYTSIRPNRTDGPSFQPPAPREP